MKMMIGAVVVGISLLSLGLARPVAEIKTSGSLIFGNSRDYPPFYSVEKGNLVGFEIDFGMALAQRLGLKPEWRNVGFDSLFAKLGESKIDVALASHTITPNREKYVDFVIPHYCTGTVIIALVGKALDPEGLQGKVVSASKSSTFAEYGRKIPGIKEVKTFATELEAFKAMQSGKTDAYISDRLAALGLAKKYPTPRVNLSPLLTEDRIAMAVKKGNTELLKLLSDSVEAMKRDGSINRIASRYFSGNVVCD
jgi:polar amino acid transport system substrate-binding protein